MGKSLMAFVLEAIALFAKRFRNNDEAQRQSALIASAGAASDWSEQLPDWSDWTA